MNTSPPPSAVGVPATRDVVVVGGGLAGLAAAWRLARAGLAVTLLEAEPVLGGQARSFEQGGRRLPIAYHHVNPRDATLARFLGALGLLPRVVWRHVEVACLVDGRAHVLASPRGFWGYPAGIGEKARMAAVTLRAWWGHDDLALHDVDAATWLRGAVGDGALLALFDRLARLRLGVGADEVSAAWIRARLASREGATRMGCVP
ncbi:MAG: FAD-dependent oxidoreductase, partial [Pseudomonadota bacterium]